MGDSEERSIDERRRRRREQEREWRSRRRRRVAAAIGGLIVAAAAVAAVVALAGGGGGGSSSTVAGGGGGDHTAASSATSTSEATGPPYTNPVPILMYHVIDPAPADAALPELWVKPTDFEHQMNWLEAQGYNGVTLDAVYSAWKKGTPLPDKPVVVSFDDGYLSQYTQAMPILQKLGWPGVLNLKVLTLDQGELTVTEVEKMIDAGWEVDSHTINHLDVTTLDAEQLKHEIADSRKILQRKLGVPVNFFCYPAGAYDDAAVAEVKKAGYLGATSVEPGLASPDDLWSMNRIRIDGSFGLAGFKQAFRDAVGSG
jgi:peptidoglycan/xylan/chitin deacetylase (PgdA/CDA1 family)